MIENRNFPASFSERRTYRLKEYFARSTGLKEKLVMVLRQVSLAVWLQIKMTGGRYAKIPLSSSFTII